MSKPTAPSIISFFGQRAEPDDSLKKTRVQLPSPPNLHQTRSRSSSAPATMFRCHGELEHHAQSFFSGPHSLVGDAGTISERPAVDVETGSSDHITVPDAQIYASLAHRQGKSVLEELSVRQKGLVLVAAARLGYVDVVRLLLKDATELDVFDDFGENALMAAARAGQLKIVARLLKKGCSVECGSSAQKSEDAIAYAIKHGQRHAAAMMALYYNIRISQIEAGAPLRKCKGESPAGLERDNQD